jgi:polyisoprenoid-binding protein YceI
MNTLIGNLTIRDVTKPVELDVIYGGTTMDNYGNKKAGFKITGTVNRFDYNLKWNALLETGGAVVGSDVDMVCNIQLVQDPA